VEKDFYCDTRKVCVGDGTRTGAHLLLFRYVCAGKISKNEVMEYLYMNNEWLLFGTIFSKFLLHDAIAWSTV
jgi:hypothetical protein